VWYGKSYYRQLIGNHTLAFDWCHFWWPWSTFEGHFSLGCHFRVHFSYPWHAFSSHGLPAIAELLVLLCICVRLTRVLFNATCLLNDRKCLPWCYSAHSSPTSVHQVCCKAWTPSESCTICNQAFAHLSRLFHVPIFLLWRTLDSRF